MICWQGTRLPVEAFVHVKYEKIFQCERALIDQTREWLIPAFRSTGDDGSGRHMLFIIGFDDLSQLLRHQLSHGCRVGHDAKGNFPLRVSQQVCSGDFAPLVQIEPGRFTHTVCGTEPLWPLYKATTRVVRLRVEARSVRGQERVDNRRSDDYIPAGVSFHLRDL